MPGLVSQTSLLYPIINDNTRRWMIIYLDAGRADYFERLNRIEGKYTRAWSLESCTDYYFRTVFKGRYDAYLYSANAFLNSKREVKGVRAWEHFKRVIDVWDWGWDDELLTVPPDAVVDAVLNEPYDRMVVWFIQPHLPPAFGTPFTRKWREITRGRFGADVVIRDMIVRGELSPDYVRRLYEINYELGLTYARALVEEFKKEMDVIVVTSDHGELLGEHGLWLHPPNVSYEEVRVVPWLEIRLAS
ncbi:MAG: hypothetical protein GXO68_05785 [Crenarchaeota archaeon]|nr:hypothetical protein [Thermoproteota archaeon]